MCEATGTKEKGDNRKEMNTGIAPYPASLTVNRRVVALTTENNQLEPL